MTNAKDEKMADESKTPIEKTSLMLSALVERIYDTQAKLGVWAGEREDGEDYSSYFAGMHAKISSSYQSWIERENPPFNDEELNERQLMEEMLLEVAADCFGLLRRIGTPVGEAFLSMIVEQAREAIARAEVVEVLKGVAGNDSEKEQEP